MKKLNSIGLVCVLLLTFITVQNLQAKDDDKTVTITATGSGKTQDDAKQSALRSAIEQTFGVFVSSKTEIFNDQLVADEIASVANGNIQSFKILNASQLPGGEWGVTLNAVISVNKLTSFVQSKGVTVEFQGSLFAINIKQQILNEEAELKAIQNMVSVLFEPMQLGFDYKIKSENPTSVNGNNDKWKIPIEVTATTNKNMELCTNYCFKTLGSIGLSEKETSSYSSLNKPVYSITFQKQCVHKEHYSPFIDRSVEDLFDVKFRNKNTWITIIKFLKNIKACASMFKVQSGDYEFIGIRDWYSMDSRGYQAGSEYFFPIDSNNGYIKRNGVKITLPQGLSAKFNWIEERNLAQLNYIKEFKVTPYGIYCNLKHGGIVVSEENGHGLVVAIQASIAQGAYGYFDWRSATSDEKWLISKKLTNKGFEGISPYRVGEEISVRNF